MKPQSATTDLEAQSDSAQAEPDGNKNKGRTQPKQQDGEEVTRTVIIEPSPDAGWFYPPY